VAFLTLDRVAKLDDSERCQCTYGGEPCMSWMMSPETETLRDDWCWTKKHSMDNHEGCDEVRERGDYERSTPVIIAPVSLNPASTARSNPASTARPSYRGTLLTSVADTMVRCGTKYSTWIGQQVTRVRVCSRPVGRSTATSV